MFKGWIAGLLILGLSLFGTIANADDLLGSVRLSSSYGSDRTSVTKCSDGSVSGFSELQIKVLFGHAYVDKVEVEFANGMTENIYIDGILAKDSTSDWFQVSEEENCITNILVRGNGVGRTPRATLQFFGR